MGSLSKQQVDLISVTEATALVPYTRDHITLLARKNKIIATTVGRRWMVSAASLQRYYETSRREESIRQQYQSESRQRDLVINEKRHAKEQELLRRCGAPATAASAWYSVTVVLSGLLCGVVLHASALTTFINVQPLTPLAASAITTQLATSASVGAMSSVTGEFDRMAVSEIHKLSLTEGIVLLPATASTTVATEDFFSDDVTVEMINQNRGVLRLRGVPDSPELTVVRVPDSDTFTVSTVDP